MPLTAAAQPGQRLGHGDVVLLLPIGQWWQLRDGTLQVGGIPTVGIGVRF